MGGLTVGEPEVRIPAVAAVDDMATGFTPVLAEGSSSSIGTIPFGAEP